MEDLHRKLRVLIQYWIEHNSEHEQDFRDWAEKAISSSPEVAKQLQKAALKMASVSEELLKAEAALPKSKRRR